jgi:peptide/nickel transport system substrate-binding protein
MASRARFYFRITLVLVLLGLGVYRYQQAHSAVPAGQAGSKSPASESAAEGGGGRIVATLSSEPPSFNRYVDATLGPDLVARLTQDRLIRVNRTTGELEPGLAREWSSSPDGLTWTLKLRDASFSDGQPFTSADVVFSFAVLYDARLASDLASGFQFDGKPLTVRGLDDHTVVLTFPVPFGPALAILDSLPILPRHVLEPALKAGTFAKAWSTASPVSEVVGLGPFVLAEYVPAQRLRFTRNPRYWRHDDKGVALPYLDEIEVDIVPDQNAASVRLESGELDLQELPVRPEDMAAFTAAGKRGTIKLLDAGMAIDPTMLWFNLAPNAARVPGKNARPWLQRDELRQAISYAVDRQAVVDTVYLGAAEPAYGPVTTGNREWYVPDLPKTPHDPAKAKALLAAIGLTDRNGDGKLEDASGRPAQFSILTRKGNTMLERSAAVLQDQLGKAGLTVDIVALDQKALIAQFGKGDYDAIQMWLPADATDPARNLDFWLSSGGFHVWNPGQKTPATPWEARIDDLMRQQSTTVDRAKRHQLFAEVQRVFAEHVPVLYFAAPKIVVAMSARVTGAMPVALQPWILWNAEMLRVTAPPAGR